MTPETVFGVANAAALSAWLALVIFPGARTARQFAGWLVPIGLAVAYSVLVALFIGRGSGGFDSLAGVAQLFSNPWLLLAGWIHYLAFDLLVGVSEAADATERGVSRWLLTPCLILTFLFGPAGWLLYQLVRRTGAVVR